MLTHSPRLLLSSAADDLDNFYTAFYKAGALPAGGYCPDVDLSFDGLVLCGGSDVDTTLYAQEKNGAYDPDSHRDVVELAQFRAFFDAGKPVFGICRGMQLINVALGGTLIQNLPPRVSRFTTEPAIMFLRIRYVLKKIRSSIIYMVLFFM